MVQSAILFQPVLHDPCLSLKLVHPWQVVDRLALVVVKLPVWRLENYVEGSMSKMPLMGHDQDKWGQQRGTTGMRK